MDTIPFTKVTLEEAKAALQSDSIKAPQWRAKEKDWKVMRGAQAHLNQSLSLAAFKWLAALPATVRPHALARYYPRIVNRLADIWQRPVQCESFLDELMLDKRGDRHGFPREVATEIATLKTHFLATSKLMHFDVWGHRIGVD